MKKPLGYLLILYLISTTSQLIAQDEDFSYGSPIQFGAKVGINFGQLLQKTSLSTYQNNGYSISPVVGGFARMGIEIGFMSFFLQPELLYSQKRGAFLLNDANQTVEFVRIYHSVDIPVLFGMSIFESFSGSALRVGVGPLFSIPIAAKDKLINQYSGAAFSEDAVSEVKSSFALGFQAGVSYEFLKFVFDLRYELGSGFLPLSKEEYQVGGESYPIDNFQNNLQLSVGFKF